MNPSELNLLSKEYVIEHGTYFDGEEICWSGEFGNLICNNKGIPFKGLLFELYRNGNLAYYSFYENGVQNGIAIQFHISGRVKSYGVYNKGLLVGKSYEWYENGMIKKIMDHYNDDYHYKYIEYDEKGIIIKQGEV